MKKIKAPRKDHTGEKFFHVEVLGPTNKRQNGCVVWECKCLLCNRIFYIPTGKLGKYKSCGCQQLAGLKKEQENSKINLIGKQFGRLIVISEAGTNGRERKWNCQCQCGNIVAVSTSNLQAGHTKSCGCLDKSAGEQKIIQLLEQANIIYNTEYSFKDCYFPDTNRPARYDFYLPKYNCLIEYDGEQHTILKNSGRFSDINTFRRLQEHDQFKNNYARRHNITLIRIPYTHYNFLCLEDLLPATSQFILR